MKNDVHPLDECYCGDYRRDHKGGFGACIFSSGSHGDGHFGAGRCDQFKLAKKYKPPALSSTQRDEP